MEKRTAEWLQQADYDIDTAEYMHLGGRYLHAVFMCHLAIEKALRASTSRDAMSFHLNPTAWFFF